MGKKIYDSNVLDLDLGVKQMYTQANFHWAINLRFVHLTACTFYLKIKN